MEGKTLEQKKPENVPYIVFEGAENRAEKRLKRVLIVLAISIALLFASNALWLYAWFQYDYAVETITLDADNAPANYIGNDGDIINGEDSSSQENENAENP